MQVKCIESRPSHTLPVLGIQAQLRTWVDAVGSTQRLGVRNQLMPLWVNADAGVVAQVLAILQRTQHCTNNQAWSAVTRGARVWQGQRTILLPANKDSPTPEAYASPCRVVFPGFCA